MSIGSEAVGGMVGLDNRVSIAANYRRFARLEAAGRSPAYQRLAEFVATSDVLLGLLAGMPADKRQPNLLFAAARHLLGVPAEAETLVELVADHSTVLAEVMRTRRTQTNEAARCACLLPALAQLPSPLALLEVGASAGLTLLPDRYSYDYDGHRIPGRDPQAPMLTCHLSGPAPLPQHTPSVVWRAGLDLNPLDVSNDADLDWLASLIWPGEQGRVDRLYAAAATTRRTPPQLHRGDLLDDLAQVAAGAPHEATLVVYHTAVLAYVEPAKRAAFADAVRQLDAVWLSNEAPGVIADANAEHTVDERDAGDRDGGFVLVRNGLEQLARTDPHGTWLDWTATPTG